MARFNYLRLNSFPMLLTAGAIVLFGIVLGALYFSEKASRESDMAVQANRFNVRIVRLWSAIQGAETGQRGYILTGDDDYLAPFTKSATSISSEVSAIAPMLQSLGLPQASVDRLKSLVDEKFAEMRRTIELRQAGDQAGALALVMTDTGKNLMDEISAVIDDSQKRGIANSARHVDALRSATTLLSVFIGSSAALLIVLAALATKVIREHNRFIAAAQEKLSRVNETLEDAVASRTKGLMRANSELQSYAYIVSHDLRAPLVNIMGFTEELDRASHIFRAYVAKTGADPADADGKAVLDAVETDVPEALGFIRTSMQRMDNLINQILIMARAGNRELRREPIDVADLVSETLGTLRHRLDERDIQVEISGNSASVFSDRLALQQIVSNLLDNAIKYMDHTRAGQIDIGLSRRGALAVIDVGDNGRGIADSDQERIFELFRRSGRQDRPGDGVGLAHVRTLARRLGGDVAVRSILGQGTTFQVTIAADLAQIKKDEPA